MSMTPSMWNHVLQQEGVGRAHVVQVLRAAADHLDKVGLHKGGLFERNTVVDNESTMRCCGWGAIEALRGDGDREQAAAYLAEEALSVAVGARDTPTQPELGHFPTWNDAPKTTQAEVVAFMQATADAVETKSGVFA